jgi:DNA polymerase III delta subunit
MIYTFLGDNKKVREVVNKNIENLLLKRPDAEVFKITYENYSKDTILELVNSQGLFSSKYIIILDSLLEKTIDIKEELDLFKEMKEVSHIFFILDDLISDEGLELIKSVSEKINIFEKKEIKKPVFNVFDLANFLGNKDKKNLWVFYLKALQEGLTVEEITGTLFWQTKNIILVKKTKSQKDLKISPFAYKNAQNFAKNWKDDEILKFANSLVDVSDAVRSGEGEGEVLLERVLLTI